MEPVLRIKTKNGITYIFLSKMLFGFRYDESNQTVVVKGQVMDHYYEETFTNCVECVYE